MRVKELQKTVNVAWSPIEQTPIILAAGSAAQQLDSTFNTDAFIELYDINLSNSGTDMILLGSQASPKRFHKIIWSPSGISGGRHANGLIVGGCDGGSLQIYSAEKLLKGEEALVVKQEKHTGPVRSLDFNPFQSNLLASAASESEILIWDLNNTATPMTPGSKTQPLEDVLSVSWNRQVQHILASVFTSRCVIWDLRKNEPIIKLSDSQSRVNWRALQWHPEVATQLWLASEDDQNPVIQLWDLRYATTPAKTLQIHTRGVLGLSYCPSDSELIASCGKDFKIFCWNPKSELPGGEVLSEIATSNQWYSDITWCPKNPALIASTSLDGIVSLYSLFGGDQQQQQKEVNCKLLDSFPGMDQMEQPLPTQQQQLTTSSDLKKPPKWLRRPIGAYFGFGGKLVSFSNQQPKCVSITQVITEPELIEQTNRLEEILNQQNLSDYCRERANQTNDKHNRLMWYFLKSNFEQNPRGEMLNLLGFDKNDVSTKFNTITKKQNNGSVEQLSDQLNELNCNQNNENIFDTIATDYKESAKIASKRQRTYSLKSGSDSDSIITEAILTGNLEAAVDLCFEHGHKAEAIIIANTGGPELLQRTQKNYLMKQENYLSNVINALITNNWCTVIAQCSIDSWKEALVAALTHTQEELPILCEKLGERLQNETNNDLQQLRNAILCYICAGNIEKLINVWEKQYNNDDEINNEINLKTNIFQLQELVEIVMLLQKGIEIQGKHVEISGSVAELMESYANYLIAQGNLNSALVYLGQSQEPRLVDLRERIYYALGLKQAYAAPTQQRTTNKFGFTQPQQQQQQQQPSFLGPPIQKTAATVPSSNIPGWNLLAQQQQQTNFGYNASIPPMNPVVATMPPPPTQVGDLITSQQQPPRPSSVGSQHGSSTTTTGSSLHRSKYVLDPSVGQNNPTNYYSSNTNNNQMFTGGGSGYSQPTAQTFLTPQQSSMQQQPQSNQLYQPPVNNFTTNFNNQPIIDNYNNQIGSSGYSTDLPPPPPAMLSREKNPTPPPGWNDPPALKTARTQLQQHHQHDFTDPNKMSAEHAGTRKFHQMLMKNHENSKNLLNPKLKNDNKNISNLLDSTTFFEDFNQNNPITHPIYGQEINQNISNQQQPQQQQQLPPPTLYGAQANFNPIQQQQPPPLQAQPQLFGQPQQSHQPQMLPPKTDFNGYQQQQQQPDINQYQQTTTTDYQQNQFQTMSPSLQNPMMQQQQHQTIHPTVQRQKSIEPIKRDIPPEYIHIQKTFEALRIACIESAHNPQSKRKLEDVARRLEFLYDFLRESRLTPNTLQSLNELEKLISSGDYANSIALHTQMISGADFSQIASFMPGIKVLLQTAIQMQVFLK